MSKLDFTVSNALAPCRVYDADRVEYEMVTQCDTELGMLTKHRRRSCGGIETRGDCALTDQVLAPAPLRIEDW